MWIPDLDQVRAIRERAIADSRGGPEPIPRGELNPSAITAAIDRARHGPPLDADAATRLALLLRGTVQEHAWPNGNKRTGLLLLDATAAGNDLRVDADDVAVADFMLAVAEGLAVEDCAAWLRTRLHRIEVG